MNRRNFVRDSLAGVVGLSGIATPIRLAALPVIARPADSTPTRSDEGVFKYTIAIVGSPTTPDVRWSDERLRPIKEAGFNTL